MASLRGATLAEFHAALNIVCLDQDDPLPYLEDYHELAAVIRVIGPRTRLWTTQDYLSLTRVKRYIRLGDDHDVPEVVVFKGKTWIWNGHHRIVAHRLTGTPLRVRSSVVLAPNRRRK